MYWRLFAYPRLTRCSGTNQGSRVSQFAFGSYCITVAQNPYGPMWISDGRQAVSRCLILGPVNGAVRLDTHCWISDHDGRSLHVVSEPAPNDGAGKDRKLYKRSRFPIFNCEFFLDPTANQQPEQSYPSTCLSIMKLQIFALLVVTIFTACAFAADQADSSCCGNECTATCKPKGTCICPAWCGRCSGNPLAVLRPSRQKG